MDKINSMSNEDKLAAIELWQSNKNYHPLTCGNDSEHSILTGAIIHGVVYLICKDCGCKQKFIPNVIYKNYLDKIK